MDRINNKGFTYIVITLILIIFITLLFMLFKNLPTVDKTTNNISRNYVIELEYLIGNDLNQTNLDNLNNSFYNYARAHNYDVNICTIIDDSNGSIYRSNYLQSTQDGVNDKTTVKNDKSGFTSSVTLGNCYLDFDVTEQTSYYISFSNNQGKIVYKNQNLPS